LAQIADKLCVQRLALISPLERFCHRPVVIFDESQHLALEIILGSNIAAFEDFPNQDAELNLDLVHPGSVCLDRLDNHLGV
jgi:hypothetical protein